MRLGSNSCSAGAVLRSRVRDRRAGFCFCLCLFVVFVSFGFLFRPLVRSLARFLCPFLVGWVGARAVRVAGRRDSAGLGSIPAPLELDNAAADSYKGSALARCSLGRGGI